MRQGKWMARMLLGMSSGLLLTGCFTGGIYQVPGNESLATDLTAEAAPRTARSQQPDPSGPNARPPLAPPPLSPPPLPPGSGDIKQLSLSTSKNTRVSVRAWVNGKPIFDEEVMQGIAPNMIRDLSTMPEPRRSERLTEAYNQALDAIIDQEVAYQDAVHKLQSTNKKALEKIPGPASS